MRVTSKGQVTIPIQIRQQLDITTETELVFEVVGDRVQISKVPAEQSPGKSVVDRLRTAKYIGPSTDELMKWTRGED